MFVFFTLYDRQAFYNIKTSISTWSPVFNAVIYIYISENVRNTNCVGFIVEKSKWIERDFTNNNKKNQEKKLYYDQQGHCERNYEWC